MTQYRLLKDLPNRKAETLFIKGGVRNDCLFEITDKEPMKIDIKDIDNFDEWFEEIATLNNNTQHKPKDGDKYYFIKDYGTILEKTWDSDVCDKMRLEHRNAFKTEEEAEKEREFRKAWSTLRYSSSFIPDWENIEEAKYFIGYDSSIEKFRIQVTWKKRKLCTAYYRTIKEAESAFKSYEKELAIAHGIDE